MGAQQVWVSQWMICFKLVGKERRCYVDAPSLWRSFCAENNKHLYRQRMNHIRARHPEVELGDPRLHMQSRVLAVVDTNQIPMGQGLGRARFVVVESRSSREVAL